MGDKAEEAGDPSLALDDDLAGAPLSVLSGSSSLMTRRLSWVRPYSRRRSLGLHFTPSHLRAR